MKALLELGLTLEQIDRLACATALDAAGNNKSEAARRLALERRALSRRLPPGDT